MILIKSCSKYKYFPICIKNCDCNDNKAGAKLLIHKLLNVNIDT